MMRCLFFYITMFTMQVCFAAESPDERGSFEWHGSSATYVFLDGVGVVGRLEADRACRNAGLSPIFSTDTCPGTFYVTECIARLGRPLEEMADEIIASPIWGQLPILEGNASSQLVKGFWFGGDYRFKLEGGGNTGKVLYIRFYARENISPDHLDPKLYTVEVNPDEQSQKLSVICRK